MKLPEILKKIGVPRFIDLTPQEKVAFVERVRESRIAPPPKKKKKKKGASSNEGQLTLPKA